MTVVCHLQLQQLREELQQTEAAAQEEAEAAAGAAREAEAREASDRRLRAELEQELDQSTQVRMPLTTSR